MKTIAVFDSKNYDANGPRTLRKAVRAVIMKNGKVALAQSLKEGFYKFPGGGIEEGETHLETLCRETLEELGLTVKADTVKEFGRIYEIRRSLIYDGIFEQENFYYTADAEDSILPQSLTQKEKDLDYTLCWIDPKEAFAVNHEMSKDEKYTFLKREAFILEML